jgi:peptidoglycan DL-endopeptidase CwlO
VTGVEHYSTTRSGRRSRWQRIAGVVISAVVTATVAALPLTGPVAADPLASARAQAAQLAQQIQAQGERLASLSEQYDASQLHVNQLDTQLSETRAAITQTQAQVDAARANLREQALDAYMSGGTDSGLEQLFTSGGEQSAVAQEYRSVAGGNVSSAIDHLDAVESTLSQQQGQLQATEQAARGALGQADAARRGAQAALAGQQATLSHVKGQIATLVAQQQAAEAAAQAAAFQAQLAAARAKQASLQSASPGLAPAPPAPPAPPVAGGAGAKAVAAAESQIGVPYVYGGATPGVGFDCSGLTMWAWEQAGVSLSHSAAAQYDETTHIPLTDLQPGDLLFYDEGGTIGHVTMYVGPGEMIQAEETGTRIQITGIWSTGLVGAGRP